MATILNETAMTLSVSEQQTIRNAAASAGVDIVQIEFAYSNDDNPVFDVNDEEGNYLFSLDTDGDIVFNKNA